MRLGLGVLRLAPAAFWSMTPRELNAALHGAMPPPPNALIMDRPALAALMQRYPDT